MKNKRLILLEQELAGVRRAEEKLKKSAIRSGNITWKTALEQKIPPGAYTALKKAFGKAFSLVFEKGTGIIEKTFDKDAMAKDHEIYDYAVQLKGGRREIRRLRRDAAKRDAANMAAAAAEGVGLGVFGVGLPDIVLFSGVLLKGVYQAALLYGISYESPQETYFILKMMEAAMAKGEDFVRLDKELDQCVTESGMLCSFVEFSSEQLSKTAEAFAADLLLLKFVQGIPLVGILGGMGNPACYRRVMRYVGLKYRKRYLLKRKQSAQETAGGV